MKEREGGKKGNKEKTKSMTLLIDRMTIRTWLFHLCRVQSVEVEMSIVFGVGSPQPLEVIFEVHANGAYVCV